MALQKLVFRPGVNKENTNYSGEGGWYDCDKVRFRSGFPEKIGGWVRLSNQQYLGVARSLWNWSTLNSENLLGVGTNLKYYIEKGGAYYDVTPIIDTETYTNKLSTAFGTLNGNITAIQNTLTLTNATNFPVEGVIKIDNEEIFYASKSGNILLGLNRGYNGTTAATHTTGANVACATITLEDTANIADNNDFIIISGSSAIGGISAAAINKEHQVVEFASGTCFITTTEFSTSQVLNSGGAITVRYLEHVGLNTYTVGTGWGAGPWSRGTWGSGYTTGIGQQLRLWTNDNFGEDLIIAPRGGSLYYWDATTGVAARSIPLATAADNAGYDGDFVPNATNQIIASSVQRFVLCFGSNPYDPGNSETPFDPLLVRWSDQENAYDWIPSALNQSGEQRLTNGSYIMCAKNTRQEILVWTDAAVFSMQYLGPPYVWGFTLLQDNISIMSPNAAITVNNVTYWMGKDKFFMYSGRVETLPCSLRQFVFQNLNVDQAWQCFAGANEAYSEIWWFYPSKNSTVVDSYVVYNYLDRVWYYGSMGRTAWLDSGIREYPMGADYNNRILYHEVGVDDVSGPSAVAIPAYIQSSDIDIGDGHNFGFVWRILPDVTFAGSTGSSPSCTMVVKPRTNSGTNYGAPNAETVARTAVIPVEQFTGQVYTRIRGRQMAFRIESGNLGTAWQLGSPRIDIRPDGRR